MNMTEQWCKNWLSFIRQKQNNSPEKDKMTANSYFICQFSKIVMFSSYLTVYSVKISIGFLTTWINNFVWMSKSEPFSRRLIKIIMLAKSFLMTLSNAGNSVRVRFAAILLTLLILRKCEKGSVSVVVLQDTLHQSSFFVKKGRVCTDCMSHFRLHTAYF